MLEWILISLVGAGFAILLITPRERNKKTISKKNEFDGYDDYAVLMILVKNRRYKEAKRKIRKVYRDEANIDRKRLIDKVWREVERFGR